MSGLGKLLAIGLVAGAAGWAGLAAGERGVTAASLVSDVRVRLAGLSDPAVAATPSPTSAGRVVYYRHPDGRPEWSAAPASTADGRDLLPVYAGEDVSFDPAPPQAEAADGERRILYYRNPMGLPDTSAVPKKDSMGMDYLPVYEGEAEDDGVIRVSAGKLQRSGVRSTEAIRAPMGTTLRAPGIVTFDDRRISVIALRADAFVESVADVATGTKIRQGAALAQIYSPEVTAAAALFIADLRGGAARAKGSRQRLENLGLPTELIDRIAAEGRAPVSFPLTAPRDGVVLERMAVEGMMSPAGETLFRIADTSNLWLMADVPEGAIIDLRRGAAASITLRGLPGAPVSGVVDEIYPEVDPLTRTARVRIDLPNPEGRILANMYAEVEIATGDGAAVVQVPDSAVIDSGERQVVIRDLGEGRFAAQDVTLGRRGGGMVEIREGLRAGDAVVISATFLLDAESNLNAALSALAAPEAGQ